MTIRSLSMKQRALILLSVVCLCLAGTAPATAAEEAAPPPLGFIDMETLDIGKLISGRHHPVFAIAYYYLPSDCDKRGYPKDNARPLIITGPPHPGVVKKVEAATGRKLPRHAYVLLLSLRGKIEAAELVCKGKDEDVTCEARFGKTLTVRIGPENGLKRLVTVIDGKETRALPLAEVLETFD